MLCRSLSRFLRPSWSTVHKRERIQKIGIGKLSDSKESQSDFPITMTIYGIVFLKLFHVSEAMD